MANESARNLSWGVKINAKSLGEVVFKKSSLINLKEAMQQLLAERESE